MDLLCTADTVKSDVSVLLCMRSLIETDLCVDVDLAPHLAQGFDQLLWMPVDTQPHSIQEDFGGLSDDRFSVENSSRNSMTGLLAQPTLM